MKKVIAGLLSAVISMGALALEPDISIHNVNRDKPVLIGYTNLPDGMKLSVSVQIIGKYFGMENVVVQHHEFYAGPFSNGGASLPSGEVVVSVQSADPRLQPDAVQAVIGEEGQHLSGRHVSEILSCRVVDYQTTIRTD